MSNDKSTIDSVMLSAIVVALVIFGVLSWISGILDVDIQTAGLLIRNYGILVFGYVGFRLVFHALPPSLISVPLFLFFSWVCFFPGFDYWSSQSQMSFDTPIFDRFWFRWLVPFGIAALSYFVINVFSNTHKYERN